MKTIHAVWKDGRIVPTEPVDWPEGTPLTVEPAEGVRDSDLLGDDPDAAARWVAWFDTLEPLEFTPDEEAAWEAARRERRELCRVRCADQKGFIFWSVQRTLRDCIGQTQEGVLAGRPDDANANHGAVNQRIATRSDTSDGVDW